MTSLPNKYVKIMADYCADPVWTRSGNADLDNLPVSEGTRIRLGEWAWFYDSFADDYMPGPHRFPTKEFTVWGFRLARQVKDELPDWTVVYYSDETHATFEITGEKE